MPIYEYYCYECNKKDERLCAIASRNHLPLCVVCDDPMELIVSVPSISIWNAERSFPNLTGHNDGSMTFPTRQAYRAHLDDSGVDELSTSAPNKMSHGNKLVGSWK